MVWEHVELFHPCRHVCVLCTQDRKKSTCRPYANVGDRSAAFPVLRGGLLEWVSLVPGARAGQPGNVPHLADPPTTGGDD